MLWVLLVVRETSQTIGGQAPGSQESGRKVNGNYVMLLAQIKACWRGHLQGTVYSYMVAMVLADTAETVTKLEEDLFE